MHTNVVWHVVTLTVSSAPWRDTEPAVAEIRGDKVDPSPPVN